MSISPLQRQALAWAARPPGPPAFWYAVGSALRSIGASIDAVGIGVQGDCGTVEKLPIPTTGVKLGGKAPAVAGASFVAPSANLVGAVTLGEGASAWYGAMLQGRKSTVEVGALSSVGDKAVVVDSVVGSYCRIGAGALIDSAKLADNCSVGMGCIVGKGASLGKGAALTAGSVLPAGKAVPAGQVWGGNPAAQVGEVSADDAEGAMRTAEVTAELGKLHMDEAWKDYQLVNEELEDRKRERHRTPDFISSLREDPKWVPLPSLGEHLTRMGIHSVHYTPP